MKIEKEKEKKKKTLRTSKRKFWNCKEKEGTTKERRRRRITNSRLFKEKRWERQGTWRKKEEGEKRKRNTI
jgi:hypothetical protein